MLEAEWWLLGSLSTFFYMFGDVSNKRVFQAKGKREYWMNTKENLSEAFPEYLLISQVVRQLPNKQASLKVSEAGAFNKLVNTQRQT